MSSLQPRRQLIKRTSLAVGASPILLFSPNADQTRSLRSTRALANLLALFVRGRGSNLDMLFSLAKPPANRRAK
jgi:hypothetical protein